MKNNYEVRGDVTAIFIDSSIYGLKETLISTDKLKRAQEFPNNWHLHWNKFTKTFYVRGNKPTQNGKRGGILFHRWILNTTKGMVIDHIDHDTLNNTNSNMRIVTQAENMKNKALYTSNTSGYRGVFWHKSSGKWGAQISFEGKNVHLGLFETLEDAGNCSKKYRMLHMPLSQDL